MYGSFSATKFGVKLHLFYSDMHVSVSCQILCPTVVIVISFITLIQYDLNIYAI